MKIIKTLWVLLLTVAGIFGVSTASQTAYEFGTVGRDSARMPGFSTEGNLHRRRIQACLGRRDHQE